MSCHFVKLACPFWKRLILHSQHVKWCMMGDWTYYSLLMYKLSWAWYYVYLCYNLPSQMGMREDWLNFTEPIIVFDTNKFVWGCYNAQTPHFNWIWFDQSALNVHYKYFRSGASSSDLIPSSHQVRGFALYKLSEHIPTVHLDMVTGTRGIHYSLDLLYYIPSSHQLEGVSAEHYDVIAMSTITSLNFNVRY